MDLLIPLALAALLIFFLFNSRRKQKARAEQIKSGLVPGATVMTTFGVFGTVLDIDDENNQVTIESGPGTVLRVHRQAIGQINNPEAEGAAAGTAVAGTADTDVSADDKAAPAITDAELDAMNERKRAEGTSADDDATVTDADLNAEDDTLGKKDSDSLDSDVLDSDTATSADKTDAAAGDDLTDIKDESEADSLGTDSSDPENPKKN